MNAKHTPGPWEVLPDSSVVFGVNDPERYEGHRVAVAQCGDEIGPLGGLKYGDQRDANARLIAAAPDLLGACLALIEAWDNGRILGGGSVPAQAIKKAAELALQGKKA